MRCKKCKGSGLVRKTFVCKDCKSTCYKCENTHKCLTECKECLGYGNLQNKNTYLKTLKQSK